MAHKNSPFKFLDAYEKADVDVFFGRDKEIKDLYNALSGVKHLLVYGPSGSGKSSLVECGLRNQFSDTDWFALTIRKGDDINASVFLTINEALDTKIVLDPKTNLPMDSKIGFGEAIEYLFEERYQPIYLLFDQFEELLISGEQDEKIKFFTSLNKLIRSQLPSRVLLIMREEFIGHFSEFEHLCPSIFQHRFRVEKMGRTQVKDVVQAMLEAPQYREHFDVEDSMALAAKILTKLPDKRKEIELSHVQVFLGELWDRANSTKQEGKLPLFSAELLKKNDDLESVLESFLKKQMHELESSFGKGVPLELLATIISEKFTKIQLSASSINEKLETNEVTSLRPIEELLQELQTRRIIRALKIGDESQYEISHDTLALVVGQNLTEKMKMRENALRVYNTYTQQQGLFSQENIDYLRAFETYLAYPDLLQNRIKDSELKIKAEKTETLQKQKKQLRRTRIFASIISIMAIAAIVASVFAVKRKLIADGQTKKAQSLSLATLAHEQIKINPTLAFGLAKLAWDNYPTNYVKPQYIQQTLFESFNDPFIRNNNVFYKKIDAEIGNLSADFSPDKKYIVYSKRYGLDSSIVEIRNLKSNEAKVLDTFKSQIYRIKFSPDGNFIATCSLRNNEKLTIWDVKTKKTLTEITTSQRDIKALVFSSDGNQIATFSPESKIKIWSISTGKPIEYADSFMHSTYSNNIIKNTSGSGNFDSNGALIKNIAYSNDLNQLSIITQKSTIIYNVTSGEELIRLNIGPEDNMVNAIFSPDNNHVLGTFNRRTMQLFDITTGEPVENFSYLETAYLDTAFSKNGDFIYTASKSGTVKSWDLKLKRKVLNTVEEFKQRIADNIYLHKKEKFKKVYLKDSITQIIDNKTGDIIWSILGNEDVEEFRFSPREDKLIYCSGSRVPIWDINTNQKILEIRGYDQQQLNLTEAAFSKDGTLLIIKYLSKVNGPQTEIWYSLEGILEWTNKNSTNLNPITYEDLYALGLSDDLINNINLNN